MSPHVAFSDSATTNLNYLISKKFHFRNSNFKQTGSLNTYEAVSRMRKRAQRKPAVSGKKKKAGIDIDVIVTELMDMKYTTPKKPRKGPRDQSSSVRAFLDSCLFTAVQLLV